MTVPEIRIAQPDSIDVVLDTTGLNTNRQQWIDMRMSGAIENVTGYSLLWVRVPYAYDVIDSGNNEFVFNTGAVDYLCRLQIGTYNAAILQNVFQSALALAGVPNPYEFQIFVGSFDGQLVIWHPTRTFSLQWSNNVLTRMFGFSHIFSAASVSGLTYDAHGALVNGGVAVNYLKSPDAVDLQSIANIKFWTSIQSASPSSRDVRNDQSITAIIPVTSSYGGVIHYRHKVQMLPMSSPQTVTDLRVQISAADDRESTYYDTPSGQFVKTNFLPIGGLGFQFGVRFYFDHNDQ